MKILILGVTGLLGNTAFRFLSRNANNEIFGALRSPEKLRFFEKNKQANIYVINDMFDFDSVKKIINKIKPEIVINCIGVTNKTALSSFDTFKTNSLLPKKLSIISRSMNIKFIHISTDCVFSGRTGFYKETDIPDPENEYGLSKLLGEINDGESLTIRTSLIGHEINSRYGLLEWFLSQKDKCDGYSNVIFSGFPTVTFSEILEKHIFSNLNLKGIIHIASNPINKFELLKLISRKYNKTIRISENDHLKVNRSLNANFFNSISNIKIPEWEVLIDNMLEFR
jgi:dTDP-4-dehydrorhamnose reductase